MNRLKRQNVPKKVGARPTLASSSAFRDRGGSNRIVDRPRLRSFLGDTKPATHHQYPIGDSGVFVNHHPASLHVDEALEAIVSPVHFLSFFLSFFLSRRKCELVCRRLFSTSDTFAHTSNSR